MIAFIERLTQNFIIKFREYFLWSETVPSAQRMKSYKKLFFCQNYAIFWEKMVHAVIERYFPLFLQWFEDFLITDSPFKIQPQIYKGDPRPRILPPHWWHPSQASNYGSSFVLCMFYACLSSPSDRSKCWWNITVW